jgi:ribonuclease Z
MSFKVTILGSSGALPAYGRYPTAQFVEIQNHYFLIDAGEGVQQQLSRYQIPFHKISHIFISHLHGDHYLGLTGLLFTMHLQRRVNDLHLYSHQGLDEILLLQLKHSKSVLNYKIIFHTLDASKVNLIFEDAALTVESFPLFHKIDCTGFKFSEKVKSLRINKELLREDMLLQHIARLKTGEDVLNDDGSTVYKSADFTLPPRASFTYAYCSDTAFFEELIPTILNADLLYHESTFMEEDKDKAAETRHSTAAQAATMASMASVKKLIIGHFSARYRELEPMLKEARAIFPATSLAIEGETFELEV